MPHACEHYLKLYLLRLQPVISLDGSISHTFPNEGMHTITVQVAAANTILQDSKTIAVKGQYWFSNCLWELITHVNKSVLLASSKLVTC